MSSDLSYRDAGVDIAAGNALVDAIKPAVRSTSRRGLVGGIGGFGGIFDPAEAGYRDPLLISATDGVGTKLRVAFETGDHRSVGIDLVAMCVNDLIVQGAEPLFFLDYFATSRLDVERAASVIEGIAEGCRIAGCALIGGETAELPGFYAGDEYDLAGFAVGAVERENLLPRPDVNAGDAVIGLAASGVHSNGFSLVRKVVEKAGITFDDPAPFANDRAIGAVLLEPTRIYVKPLLAALRSGAPIRALCHITGGGLIENVPRVLPAGLGVALDIGDISRPPVFDWIAGSGPVRAAEMARTFNCGIGMIAIVPDSEADAVIAALGNEGETAARIGTVTASPDEPVTVKGGPGA